MEIWVANAKCLSDLTANDWNGKADAISRSLINSTKVRAWICDDYLSCNDAVAGVDYYFAVSGDIAKGGAYFTADSSNHGPDNLQNWSGTNYFGGMIDYWTGRLGSAADDDWGGSHWQSNYHCAHWTDSTAGETAVYGVSNGVNYTRWNNSTANCNITKNLVCYVHP
jgi:hypothetical protein